MNDIISPDDLAGQIAQLCRVYAADVVEKVDNGIVNIGEEALQEVKELVPVYKGKNKNTVKGAYRRHFGIKLDRWRSRVKATVYVKGEHYRLTHLLEDGHPNRDGTTRSREFPHISIANEHAQKKVDKLLEGL